MQEKKVKNTYCLVSLFCLTAGCTGAPMSDAPASTEPGVLEWGAAFADVGRAVQERVSSYLARMADLQPARVDVIVDETG